MFDKLLRFFKKVTSKQIAVNSAEDFINAQNLLNGATVDEHCRIAERYFGRLDNYDYLLAKPLIDPDVAPALLINFAKAIQGLRLQPGLRVLDFGAGSCWTSKWLTQLGANVIAMDVSPTALKIGRELFDKHPVFGDKPEPAFLVFNGEKFELEDESVDRILCNDAFHHVPNPDTILKEMGRVLKEGGVAAFVEPGENHSKSPQSQQEMKNFGVIENDVVIKEIWDSAKRAGFTGIEFAVYGNDPFYLSLKQYEDFKRWGGPGAIRFARQVRSEIKSRNTFFLFKGEPPKPDSRSVKGLQARLWVRFDSVEAKEGESFLVKVEVTNNGQSVWLPGNIQEGGVNLGAHLMDESGNTLELDYYRHSPTEGKERNIEPGETVSLALQIPAPTKGRYIMEFDMVAENVCWFAFNGSPVVRIKIESR